MKGARTNKIKPEDRPVQTGVIEDLDPNLTAKEVGQLLHIHPSSVYKAANRGELPGFKIGGDWRFSLKSIIAFTEGKHPTK